MKIDMTLLNAEVEAGMVNKQNHPSLPLFIYKYSNECVYSRHWNEITMKTRGLVLDYEGNIVVHSINKFFNHFEADGIEAYNLHKGIPYVITEKMDGSLIQVAKWKANLIVTSSGSFTSPQALKAQEMIVPYIDLIEDGKTYIFEIIYEGNRIVISYPGINQLTLLAVRDTDTGHEFPLDFESEKFIKVKVVNKTLEEIEAELSQKEFINSEGYVVRFADGYRVKLKYDAYMFLHKLVSGINEKWVHESLMNGINIEEALKGIPDELFQFVKDTMAELKFNYSALEDEAKRVYDATKEFSTRKEQAAFLMKNYKDVAHIVFCMLDGKDYSEKIWKDIKPESVTMFGRGEA